MKIYTKRGDSGETDLISKRVMKSDIAIHLVGEIDEAQARLALAKYHIVDEKVRAALAEVDQNLFKISSMIVDQKKLLGISIDESSILALETKIDSMDLELPVLKKFITYDGTIGSIQLSLLRSQVRKIERLMVETKLEDNVLKYMNRLSDYLFTLMRWINFKENITETLRG